jgi:hypothetical protein
MPGGAFSFGGLPKGAHTSTASKTGCTFSRKTVSIVNQSLANRGSPEKKLKSKAVVADYLMKESARIRLS